MMLLGAGLAWQMQAQVGDQITVLIPETVPGTTELRPRLQSFTVGGIFEFGAQEQDNSLVLIHLSDAAALAGTDGAPNGLRLKFSDFCGARRRQAGETGAGRRPDQH
jgi:lipoprotein-releasing system permease protein